MMDSSPYKSPAADRPLTDATLRPTWARYSALAWLCTAAVLAYICRNSISVAESTIRKELELDVGEMRWVILAFFFSYAVFQVPTGWLGHVYGSRRALPLYSVFWSLATAAMALARGLPLLLGSRLASGVAQAGLFPCATQTVARWFPENERAIANGSLGSCMSVGGAIGAGLTGLLLDPQGSFLQSLGINTTAWSWQQVFLLYSVPGMLWALGFYAWFRDSPGQHRSVGASELQLIQARSIATRGEAKPTEADDDIADRRSEPTPWLAIVSSPAMWCICSQQFFRAAGYMFFASWFATYLQETRAVTIQKSGLLTMLPLLGVVVGGLLGGILSDRVLAATGSRRLARQGVAAVSLSVCAVLIFAAYAIDDALLAVLVISAGSLAAALAGAAGYTITIDMGGRHVATVFATMNMCGNLGAVAFVLVVPEITKATGQWDAVLLVFGAMYVCAAGCWLLLNPQGSIFDQSWIRPPGEDFRDDAR